MCVLMLRGAQTPGELKQRSERMHLFAGLEEVNETLQRLISRGLVARLERRPGQKEERFEHLLEDRAEDEDVAGSGRELSPAHRDGPAEAGSYGSVGAEPGLPDAEGAVASLLERVAKLEREMAELRAGLDGSGEASSSEPVPAVRE
jgi:uncharacterized protein YceH (UPF0502 family)